MRMFHILFKDLSNLPDWMAVAFFIYAIASGVACFMLVKWGLRRSQRISALEKDMAEQKDLTRTLAEARRLRSMNEQNGHHKDEHA